MNKMMNLQDTFLNQARKERILVTTYLVNGFQCKGVVKGFDNYVVIFDCQGQQQVIQGARSRSRVRIDQSRHSIFLPGTEESFFRSDQMLPYSGTLFQCRKGKREINMLDRGCFP